MLLVLACTLGGVFLASFLVLMAGLARAGAKPMPILPWEVDAMSAPEWSDRMRRDLARVHRLHTPVGLREPDQLSLF